MKATIYKKILSFLVAGICVIIFGFVFYNATHYSSSSEISFADNQPPTPGSSEIYFVPERLIIPAIGVDAKVEEVGLTKGGAMAVPVNFTDVGWYKYGSLPGQSGNAVIAGHINNGLAFPAVFAKLDTLKTGDIISVESESGQKLSFVVASMRAYPQDAIAPEVFSREGQPQLELITCTGDTIPSLHTHSLRLVVTAVLKN